MGKKDKSQASAPMSDAPPPYDQSGYQMPAPVGMYPTAGPPPAANPQYLPGHGQQPQMQMPGQQQPQAQYVQGPPVTQVIVAAGFGPHSMSTVCPSCNQQVLTKTEPVTGLLTWILSCSMLAMACWLGCCLLPFCIRECQDIEHKCPNCKAHLGLYRRI